MDQQQVTHTADASADAECVIELDWRQGPDEWTVVLTDRRTRRRLRATSAPELSRAINQFLRSQSDGPEPEADTPLAP
jgi:hypothetical protein